MKVLFREHIFVKSVKRRLLEFSFRKEILVSMIFIAETKKHAFLQMFKKKCPTGVYNLWVYEERHVKSFI